MGEDNNDVPDIKAQMADMAKRKSTNQSRPGQESLVPASKLAKNRRLPATMITPGGKVETSKKKAKAVVKGKKKRSDASKEKALERMEKIEARVRGREEKKAKRNRAKNAWE